MVGIHYVTLHRWLSAELIKPSVAVPMKVGQTLWRWTAADVKRARKLRAAQKRGPKPKK